MSVTWGNSWENIAGWHILTKHTHKKGFISKCRSVLHVLGHLSQTRHIALQWISAHCGIPGNKQKDKTFKNSS